MLTQSTAVTAIELFVLEQFDQKQADVEKHILFGGGQNFYDILSFFECVRIEQFIFQRTDQWFGRSLEKHEQSFGRCVWRSIYIYILFFLINHVKSNILDIPGIYLIL